MGSRVAALCFLTAAVAFSAAAETEPTCSEETIWLRGDHGVARFSITVADDPEERARGLMFVERMAPSAGMLFVYPRPQPVTFWMKNTLIPLDMIFADETGVVQRIHEEAVPGDLSHIPGGDGIQYVLEINGGMAKMLGLAPGATMRHPAIAEPA